MRIALLSLDQAWEDKKTNADACVNLVADAKKLGADLVVFPEMTLTGFSMNIENTAEDKTNSESVFFFKSIAQKFEMPIVAGVVFKDQDKATNNALWIDEFGELKAVAQKIHPFSFAGEDKCFNGGDFICKVEHSGICFGLTICYDLRFPEVFSALGKDCQVIINIANWPSKRIDHWNVLLKARAIENQIFMIGVNRVGADGNKLEYMRSSQAIHPNGIKLTPCTTSGVIDIVYIDINEINIFKRGFCTTRDRKPSFYRNII